MTSPAFDPSLVLAEMTLVGPANSADLVQAITEPPRLYRTLEGASTLEVTVKDNRRTLLTSGALVEKSWVIVKGYDGFPDAPFELVGVSKRADRLTLTFEDLIVAALRRQVGSLSIPANTITWSAFVKQLADEAGIRSLIEPTTETVKRALERNVSQETGDSKTDSWRLIADGSETRGLRAFSDGTQLIVGSDDWLAGLVSPWTVIEHQGPVHDVDFTLDVGRKDNTATVHVDARLWAVMPGRMLTFPAGMGPASGRWLAETFERYLTRQRATVTAVRNRMVLGEPPADVLPTDGPQAPGVGGLLALTGIRETPGPSSRSPQKPSGPASPRQADGAAKGGWAWPTYDKRITSPFGQRNGRLHAGIDIGVRYGQVFAARAGTVVISANDPDGYGLWFEIDHGNGIRSRYAHLSARNVKVGDRVTVGTQIGTSGNTGSSTGPHLHFEIRVNGSPKNPLNYLP